MDVWEVIQNYILAGVIAGAIGGYYYYTSNQKKPNRTGKSDLSTGKRSNSDLRGNRSRDRSESIVSNGSVFQQPAASNTRKRKVKVEAPKPRLEEPTPVQHEEKPTKESDMSTAQFAQQMLQARKGANLSSSKTQEQRIKTVKPKTKAASSLEDDASEADPEPLSSPSVSGNDVSDMLEPSLPGPSTLRITAATAPVKEKTVRQPKQEVVESKKQRQHRKKAEEQKEQRAEAERERKQMEEKQRRTAREARGEPAKNGLSSQPQSNAWQNKPKTAPAAPQANGYAHAPLLDTFDAESTSSSNGGLEASTAATSTTEGEQHQQHWESLSEEAQMAVALEQSSDDSGWTTVSAPKKTNKKKINGDASSSGVATPNRELSSKQGKASGYAALEFAQTDAD